MNGLLGMCEREFNKLRVLIFSTPVVIFPGVFDTHERRNPKTHVVNTLREHHGTNQKKRNRKKQC